MSDSSDPANGAVAVTPSDSVNIAYPRGNSGRGLWVGGAGNVVIVLPDGDTVVTFTGVLAGQILPIRVKRVNLTNTTATNIVALY